MKNKKLLIVIAACLLLTSAFAVLPVFSVQPPVDTSTYYVGTIGQPRRLDPARAYDTASGDVIMNVYEPLIFFDDKPVVEPNANHSTEYTATGADLNSFEPVLCTVVPNFGDGSISPDGKVWVFTLNDSARFQPWLDHLMVNHPADPVTPADVVYSFQRMLVQDCLGAPSWMFCLPGTGYMFYDPLDTDPDTNTIETNEAYVAKLIQEFVYTGPGVDDVTFNFSAAWPEGAMTQIFAQTWGGISNKAFDIEHGCWDGLWTAGWSTNYRRKPSNSYSPLDRYYAGFSQYTAGVIYNWPTSPGDAPAAIGSGPYEFTSWDKANKIVRMDRWVGYWRDPTFAGAGNKLGNFYTTIIEKGVDSWPTRKMLFLEGEFDVCAVPRANMFDLLDSTANMYDPIEGVDLYYGMPGLSNDVAAFVLNVSSTTPYHSRISGVPHDDFFYNAHVRRAFSYALNFTAYLADAWWGEAVQQQSWWVDGLNPGLGYKNESLTPKNLDYTIMTNELTLAEFDGQSVFTTGFETYLIYNIGNDQRKIACEMIRDAFASLGSKFKCNVIGIDWPVFLDYEEEMYMPMFFVGWLADFADADNFARPYMHTYGDFSYFQSYSDPHVDSLIDTGIVTADGPARAAIYQELQWIYWRDAPGIPLMQAVGRRWVRDWVRGWYYNQLYPGRYYYDEYKQPTVGAQNIDLDITKTVTEVVYYPKVYWYKGQARIGNGDPTAAVYSFSCYVERKDATPVAVRAAVGVKRVNGTQFYETQFCNSTQNILLAALGNATVPLIWWEDGSGAVNFAPNVYWNTSGVTNPTTSTVVDTDLTNNEIASIPNGKMIALGPLIADLNGDGSVDILDAILLSNSFGLNAGDTGFNTDADLNADKTVDILDAIILANHFGETLPGP